MYVLAATLAQLGPEPVAEALARSEYLRGMRLRVLQFSMAQDTYSEQNDQSRLLNQQLVAHLNRIVPSFDVQIDVVQHPFDVAERIRHARIVVGDEQHTRILAAAYDVPRLTLATPYSPKATRYHRTWDPRLPLEVPFDELDDAVAAALTAAADPSVVERARELSRLADDNLKDLAAQTTNAEAL